MTWKVDSIVDETIEGVHIGLEHIIRVRISDLHENIRTNSGDEHKWLIEEVEIMLEMVRAQERMKVNVKRKPGRPKKQTVNMEVDAPVQLTLDKFIKKN